MIFLFLEKVATKFRYFSKKRAFKSKISIFLFILLKEKTKLMNKLLVNNQE